MTGGAQVVLADKHLDWARTNPAFDKILAEHREKNPHDNVPIPFDDPDPQLYTPYTSATPCALPPLHCIRFALILCSAVHTQIHREAFHYGGTPDRLDQRLVIHLRWYTKQDPQASNRVAFNSEKPDIWGLPSPSFHLKLSEDDNARNELSMADMKKVGARLLAS